ncbi:MAG: hypothetical protein HY674_09460 [Chloroflexi bacterium]|nr:hypothetical protein [Chloroflexota bacterium]
MKTPPKESTCVEKVAYKSFVKETFSAFFVPLYVISENGGLFIKINICKRVLILTHEAERGTRPSLARKLRVEYPGAIYDPLAL